MRELIIQSVEEELGKELYRLYVPSDIKDEDLQKALDMASNYASVTCWDIDEEDAEYYGLDEHWKEIFIDGKNDLNGIERFFIYLRIVYGWKSEDITYDYEFEW